MKMLRLVYSLAIYLIVTLAYAVAAMWVYDGSTLLRHDKIDILLAGLAIFVPVALLLEVGDLRGNIIEALLYGDDE